MGGDFVWGPRRRGRHRFVATKNELELGLAVFTNNWSDRLSSALPVGEPAWSPLAARGRNGPRARRARNRVGTVSRERRIARRENATISSAVGPGWMVTVLGQNLIDQQAMGCLADPPPKDPWVGENPFSSGGVVLRPGQQDGWSHASLIRVRDAGRGMDLPRTFEKDMQRGHIRTKPKSEGWGYRAPKAHGPGASAMFARWLKATTTAR